MKNLSKVVQLALLYTVVLMGQRINALPTQKEPVQQKKAANLEPIYKNQQQLEQEKKAAAEQQRIQQKPARMSGTIPSAPPVETRGGLYPSLDTTRPLSTLPTAPSTTVPPKRMTSPEDNRALTKEEKKDVETAAQCIKKIWGQYYLSIQAEEENKGFDKEDWDIIILNIKNLENALNRLKNPKLNDLLKPIITVFNSQDVWNIEIVATHLYNLITAINQFADTLYDLTDIAEYIAIEAEENPLYSGYTGMTDWLYSWGNKPREAWTSAKQAAASTWDYAKQKVQYAKSFVGQPSKEEFNTATMRLSEIKRIEQITEKRRTKTDQALLDQYKLTEAQDKAMVAKWWPYLVTAATLGAFYYMFPEFSKNIAGYGAGAVGYVAKPVAAGAVGYGGYKLLTSEPTPTKKTRSVAKPTPMTNR